MADGIIYPRPDLRTYVERERESFGGWAVGLGVAGDAPLSCAGGTDVRERSSARVWIEFELNAAFSSSAAWGSLISTLRYLPFAPGKSRAGMCVVYKVRAKLSIWADCD